MTIRESFLCEIWGVAFFGAAQVSNLRKLFSVKIVFFTNQSDELILYPHCLFDYCVNETVVFPLNNTDIQCAYDRSGLLCGACKNGTG